MGKNRQKANLTSNNLITSDITNDRIGINSTSPTTTLDVNGTVTATSFSGSASNMTGLTGASAATYGDSGATPVITVDANGKISGISTAAISSGGGGVTTGKAIAMAMVFG